MEWIGVGSARSGPCMVDVARSDPPVRQSSLTIVLKWSRLDARSNGLAAHQMPTMQVTANGTAASPR